MAVDTIRIPMPQFGRELHIRPDTSDQRSVEDAMAGYHIPPEQINPLTVVDLGANIGITSCHYESMWPNAYVVAVEMDAANADVARLNTDALVLTCAVASHAGMRSYDAAGPAEAYRLDSDGTWMAHARPLDLIIERHLNGHCHFCKMDVEGAEWELFDVGETWAPLVDCLLVELHSHGAPDPPPPPWPEGRDGPSPLLAVAIPILSRLGYVAVPHVLHPHAVWAVRA